MISSRYVLKKLNDDGWYVVKTKGDHVQLKHPTKSGKVTIQHPVKDLSLRNIISIEKQSGVRLRP